MRPAPHSRIVRCLAVAGLAACGPRGDAGRAGDSATPVAAVTPPPPAAGADTSCRKAGLWAVCSVEDRLVHAGLVIVRQDGAARLDLFSVAGTTYHVGAGDDSLLVFLYPSEAARRDDTAKLDSLAVAPRGEHRSYRVPPLLVTSANLAALVFTRNERSQERMALALSAGLPPGAP